MKTFFRIVIALILVVLLLGVYFFRFADELIQYRGGDGKVVFGYDRAQRKWLFNEYQRYTLGMDGPHIFYQDSSLSQINTQAGKDSFIRTRLPAAQMGPVNCRPQDTSVRPFTFFLKSLRLSPSVYPELPPKLLAISDIEGNVAAFVKLLRGNSVIDSQYNWIFGQGHLVLVGDFMDRGIDVLPCLYLIYKLEQEAELAGGQVHFILGNHEQMNLQGTATYVEPKYRELVRQLGIPYRELFSTNTELGRWLRTKNCIEQIGDYLFLHAGISRQVADLDLSLESMNEICRKHLDVPTGELGEGSARQLLGRNGILWYRGMAADHKGIPKQSAEEFSWIAGKLGVKTIVIGHTVADNIMTDYAGRLIRIDVHHAKDDPEALMIEDGQPYATDIRGKLRKL